MSRLKSFWHDTGRGTPSRSAVMHIIVMPNAFSAGGGGAFKRSVQGHGKRATRRDVIALSACALPPPPPHSVRSQGGLHSSASTAVPALQCLHCTAVPALQCLRTARAHRCSSAFRKYWFRTGHPGTGKIVWFNVLNEYRTENKKNNRKEQTRDARSRMREIGERQEKVRERKAKERFTQI